MTNKPAILHVTVALSLALCAGCGRLKPAPLINEHVQVADRNVVIFFVDGFDRDVYREMMAAGELPNLDRYLARRGVTVTNAVTVAPSITYAVTTSVATGMTPGRHGILGNMYFDRHRLSYTSYNTIATYRDLDADFHPATIYEMLDDKFSVTIQTPLRRGAYRNIDNWASSGIRWYFNQIPEIDALTAERFALIGQLARRARRWPELIWAYMPAPDEIAHRYGADSDKYRAALINTDEHIGRICAALEANGLLDKTYLILFSDHGHVPCPQDNYLDLADLLTRKFPLKIASQGPDDRTAYSKRAEFFQPYDATLVVGGNRRAHLYLKAGPRWTQPANPAQTRPLAEELVRHQAVAVTAYRADAGIVVHGPRGRALITRHPDSPGQPLNARQYRYQIIDGDDPLGYTTSLRDAAVLDGDYHSGRDWLRATADTDYPDAPVALLEMFDSPRAGDLAIFAAPGWDFAEENVGGHGSIYRRDMLVPLIIAGPDLKNNATLDTARLIDIAPTIIEMLDGAPPPLDGRSLLPELKDHPKSER